MDPTQQAQIDQRLQTQQALAQQRQDQLAEQRRQLAERSS